MCILTERVCGWELRMQVHFQITNPSTSPAAFAVSTNQPRRLAARPKRGTLKAGASASVAVTLDGDAAALLANDFKAGRASLGLLPSLVEGEAGGGCLAGMLLVQSVQEPTPNATASSAAWGSNELVTDPSVWASGAAAAASATVQIIVSFRGLEAAAAGTGGAASLLRVSAAELLDRHIDAVRQALRSPTAETAGPHTPAVSGGADGDTGRAAATPQGAPVALSVAATANPAAEAVAEAVAEAAALRLAYRKLLGASISLTAERDRLAVRAHDAADALRAVADPNRPTPKKNKSTPTLFQEESGPARSRPGAGGSSAGGGADASDEADPGFSLAQVLAIVLLSFFTGRLFPLR
jgi:hypothetical protein